MSNSNEPHDMEHSAGSSAATASVDGVDAGLVAGRVLGGRYEIRGLLGRGGMGSVWRAFDLKLRVEVALKSVRPDVLGDSQRLELLRREVRAAREVMSPNVCRIFDLVEADGAELVSMELVDGGTLLDLLREQGPLELKQAQEIASQFLAGLEAIHVAGLVHRDVKPENIMITRSGRVVVMDFGLARGEQDPSHSVSGTPAYMAPEQLRGEAVDARADVYAAGVVLAEMVSPEGVRSLQSRQTVWEGIRHEPPRLPSSPWAAVLRKAVAKEPEQRYGSAHTLTRALEDVTLRVEGAGDLRPYPGLASFTEDDAEYFFGREAEVEAMWARLDGPARLLGLVGPSGAGKTSFLRAGVIPAASPEWSVVRCTPGPEAMAALRQALVPALGGDTEALGALASGKDEATVSACSRWRAAHGHALLIVDQFEELFTLNADEAQKRLSELLHRLPLEADVHVVLSMRDDFLMQCNRFEPLRPVVADLMLLDPPTGANLRRALVQPATKCGYHFEDDGLVDEMLDEVAGERGVLPMLAFAAARLWKLRDRENGLLTRHAYRNIGGVGGALARHAEATIDRVGPAHIPVVRELFRNLVTAENTRAVREWGELLSVFGNGEQGDAGEVMRELVDARLLTTYEVRDEDGEPTRLVEIIHESLLANWPRLERWLAQDAEGALLRDQLRQAAHTWDEHGRTADLLWTGTAFREYRVWRERYPGGLTELEEAFADAMTAFSSRRRRLRRLVAASMLLVAVVVGAVTTTLWRRSVAEARRAEAGKLLALAQNQLEGDGTAALAFTRASLALVDTPQARRFAVEVLWSGPIARILPVKQLAREAGVADDLNPVNRFALSPDGRWIATANSAGRDVLLFPLEGGPPMALPCQPDGNVTILAFGPDSDFLITGGSADRMVFWSVPELEEIRTIELGGFRSVGDVDAGDDKLATFTWADGHRPNEFSFRAWSLPQGELVEGPIVDELPFGFGLKAGLAVHSRDRAVLIGPLGAQAGEAEQVLGEAGDLVVGLGMTAGGELVTSLDRSGEVRVWSTEKGGAGPLQVLRGQSKRLSMHLEPKCRYIFLSSARSALLWDIHGPRGAEPRVLDRRVAVSDLSVRFDSSGRWAVTDLGNETIEFWPLETPWVRVFSDVTQTVLSMAFTSDGRWLATCPGYEPVRMRPLNPADGVPRDLEPPTRCASLATHPRRPEVLVGRSGGRFAGGSVCLYPVSGGSSRALPGQFTGGTIARGVSFDPEGRRAAASPFSREGFDDLEQRVLRVWDLESGEEQVCSVAHLTDADWPGSNGLAFAHDGSLYAVLGGGGRVMRLTLPTAPGAEVAAETVLDAGSAAVAGSRDGRFLLVHASETRGGSNTVFEQLLLYDLVEGTSRAITSHGTGLSGIARIDPTGRVLVTGDSDGVVRAGPISGSEPHLLLGHEFAISSIAISRDSRWIASSSDDSIRLWPMPDMTKPPLHVLPHDELLAKLDSFTNLRAVRDETSSTGWRLEVGPFPGWETVPSW